MGCFKRTASKHVYYLGWNRSLAQVGCMRQALGPGALGRPRESGWRGRWEGGSGWGTHVNPWLFHFNVWQNPLQLKKKYLVFKKKIKLRIKMSLKNFIFPGGSEVKASACKVGDLGSIPGLGRSPGERNGNPLQYSCLENPMDRGAWWATVHGVAKSQTQLSHFHFLFTIKI